MGDLLTNPLKLTSAWFRMYFDAQSSGWLNFFKRSYNLFNCLWWKCIFLDEWLILMVKVLWIDVRELAHEIWMFAIMILVLVHVLYQLAQENMLKNANGTQRVAMFDWECASYSCHSNCRTFLSTGSYSLIILLSITLPVIKDTYAMFTSTIDVNVYVVVLCPVDEA